MLSGREVCEILKAEGFFAVRQRGSHVVMQKRSGNTTTTVPVPDHSELKTGTLTSLRDIHGVVRRRLATVGSVPTPTS